MNKEFQGSFSPLDKVAIFITDRVGTFGFFPCFDTCLDHLWPVVEYSHPTHRPRVRIKVWRDDHRRKTVRVFITPPPPTKEYAHRGGALAELAALGLSDEETKRNCSHLS